MLLRQQILLGQDSRLHIARILNKGRRKTNEGGGYAANYADKLFTAKLSDFHFAPSCKFCAVSL